VLPDPAKPSLQLQNVGHFGTPLRPFTATNILRPLFFKIVILEESGRDEGHLATLLPKDGGRGGGVGCERVIGAFGSLAPPAKVINRPR
jgi:hypothetical protein